MAAMEVSSHALALGRVAGTSYDVALFTNLSQDHLDFHETIDAYFAAKAALFTPGYARAGVVNIDDEHGRQLAAAPQIPLTTYSPAGNPRADWRAADARGGADGSAFRVIGPGGVEADASVALPGPFNVANALAAIVALVEAGVGTATAVAGVAACPGVPGRLERVEAGQDFTVFVDYAHKPGAVRAVLDALRSGSMITCARSRAGTLSAPASISASMPSGSSERGLSLVKIATSASPAAAAPISGRLARSRSPPQPSTMVRFPSVTGRSASSTARTAPGLCE